MLLGASLAVSKLVILIFEQFVSVAAFPELLVDKAVLSGQRLDVLSELRHFLGLQLCKLCLLLYLLPQALYLALEHANLIFPLEQLALVVILFARRHTHLVLDVSEFKALLFELATGLAQLFGFLIELSLHVV